VASGKIIIGILLIGFAAEPFVLQSSGVQPTATTAPDNCRGSPLPRPVPDNTSKPVVGTVYHSQSNESVVRVEYTARADIENNLTISLRSGSTLLSAQGLEQTDTYQFETEIEEGETFSIRYAVSDLRNLSGISYTSGENWIIAPTPKHQGPGVGLSPAESGFIGLHTLYLGNYTTHSSKAGCQTITMILPDAAGIDPEPRLEMLAGAARSLSTGKTYTDVYVFASPRSLGKRDGFVPLNENEIVLSANSPIQSPTNIWIHEYVHTRQVDYKGDNFGWFNEASATYYAARLSLEQGLISRAEYDAQLASFATYAPNRSLASAQTADVAYQWGAVVLARLDAALIEEGHTLMELFLEWNRYDGSSFSDALSQVENKGVDQNALNQTQATVLNNTRPDPSPAQESRWQWVPDIVLGMYAEYTNCLRGLIVGLGIGLFSWGLKQYWNKQES